MKRTVFKNNEQAVEHLRLNGDYDKSGHLHLKEGVKCLNYKVISESMMPNHIKSKIVAVN